MNEGGVGHAYCMPEEDFQDHRRNLGKGEQGRANTLPIFLYLRIVFWLLNLTEANKKDEGDSGRKGCLYVKDWFKPIFSLFLN